MYTMYIWDETKYKIKPNISRMRNQLGKHSDLNCPYCREIFKCLQTLNRHIYINKTCKVIKAKNKRKQFRLETSMERYM